MARARGFITFDSITPTLDYLAAYSALNVANAMVEGKERVEQHAQSTAPWGDRSGAARSGLTASVYEESGEIILELAHTVDYGKWLELIQDGRFATIMPTLEALGAEIIRDAGGSIFHVGANF